MLESNTKFANDGGLQKPEDQALGRGEVGADLGGKEAERRTEAGESTSNRAHGLKGLHAEGKGEAGEVNPWKDAERKGEGFEHEEWDPNQGLQKSRSSRGNVKSERGASGSVV